MNIWIMTAIGAIALYLLIKARNPISASSHTLREANIKSKKEVRQFDTMEGLETYAKENITSIARSDFPDNPEENWSVLNSIKEGGLLFIETAPNSNSVGYDSFVFCFQFDWDHQTEAIAIYCLEDGNYGLLATTGRDGHSPAPSTPPEMIEKL